MKIKFLRFDSCLELGVDKVTVLQVEDHVLFARMVASLQSERGEEADEPYALWDDAGKSLNPKKALLLFDSLPKVPFDNKTLLGRLYQRLGRMVEEGADARPELGEHAQQLADSIAHLNDALWGSYSFEVKWSLEQYLKAFGFGVAIEESSTLLERCISFLGFCVDIGVNTPIALVNVKSFLTPEALQELYSQAFFHGISLLLLESWPDKNKYESEKKIVIDQHFLESVG